MGLIAGGFFSGGGSGDILSLIATAANENTTGGPAIARITVYSEDDVNEGEVWADISGINTYRFDLLTPKANVGLYEMKWDLSSGDAPSSSSSAEGVWQPLTIAGGDFWVQWLVPSGGPGNLIGTVTASIRKGSGPSVLQTALWDGDAGLSGTGK